MFCVNTTLCLVGPYLYYYCDFFLSVLTDFENGEAVRIDDMWVVVLLGAISVCQLYVVHSVNYADAIQARFLPRDTAKTHIVDPAKDSVAGVGTKSVTFWASSINALILTFPC
jgi:hypothetical protein